jgi:hypothetical protein
MKLYKFKNGSKILFIFVIHIKTKWWTFVRIYNTGMEHWIFSLYIYIPKQIGRNLRRTIELGLGIIEFMF